MNQALSAMILLLQVEALDHVQNGREAVDGMIRVAAPTSLGTGAGAAAARIPGVVSERAWELKGQGGTVYQVVHLLPAHVKANAAVYMYYPQRSRMPMRVRYFIEFMVRRKWTAFI